MMRDGLDWVVTGVVVAGGCPSRPLPACPRLQRGLLRCIVSLCRLVA